MQAKSAVTIKKTPGWYINSDMYAFHRICPVKGVHINFHPEVVSF